MINLFVSYIQRVVKSNKHFFPKDVIHLNDGVTIPESKSVPDISLQRWLGPLMQRMHLHLNDALKQGLILQNRTINDELSRLMRVQMMSNSRLSWSMVVELWSNCGPKWSILI